MPSNWLSIDSNFPSFTGEESPEQQIRALHNYLFQLREGLQYSLQNLTADNFNTAALQNLTDAQKNEVTTQLEKVYTQLNQMAAEIDRLSGRVSGTENLSGRMTTAEGEITALKGRVKLTEGNIEDLTDRASAVETDIDDLQGRMKTAESDIGSLKGRVTITEGNIEDLAGRVKELEDDETLTNLQKAVEGEGGLHDRAATAETDIVSLKEQVITAEENIENLADRVKQIEDDQSLDDLQETVAGEGGLQEQVAESQQELKKISGAVQVAEDGIVTVGSEGKTLHLVGQIYINGVLYEQGGTT